MAKKTVLTIGMIVKNEIRCLERCLKALQPLREAVPSELIIADTGSDDGTREIAEKYADLVFDFPWINDFAAARNSVLDRANGEWFLTVDADEYLDEDCTEIVGYLSHPQLWKHNFCGVIIRNYGSADLSGSYSDFLAVRMARMSFGARYTGAIHEMWTNSDGAQIYGHRRTVFHHDGYVGLGTEKGAAKRKRNMDLLKEHLKETPGDLKTLMQCIDSCESDERLVYIREAIEGVRRKRIGWDRMGPVIFRSAVGVAHDHNIPEYEEWIQEAERLFPKSLYTTICINRLAMMSASGKKDYLEAIRRGELYLKAMDDYKAGRFEAWEIAVSALDANQIQEDSVRIILADAYFHEKRYHDARDVLVPIDGGFLDAGQVTNCMSTILNLHAQSEIDMGQYMADFWKQINKETPKKDWAALRRNAIYFRATRAYSFEFRQAEDEIKTMRHAYTLFSQLKRQCELGIATAIIDTEDAAEIKNELNSVENWERLPIEALTHAINCGVEFPTQERPLEIEIMDGLAGRLSQNRSTLFDILKQAFKTDKTTWQNKLWSRALILASVQNCPWKDEESGMELARTFANVEWEFINCYYAPEIVQEKNICGLPPLHRFGWYCARAFAALDAGDPAGYVHLLRKGLDTCKAMKPMVEFLTEHTPELQVPEPDPELLDLAGKVHDLLALYPQDDPAVVAIKGSDVYKRVAHLIETP